MPKQIIHKNIRGAEYYAQPWVEPTTETPIQRLRKFVSWAKDEGLCRSEYDFERQCGLAPKYLGNNSSNGKGNIGSEMLGRIIRVYPQLNLAWVCTGDGQMLMDSVLNTDYRQAYEGAIMQIEALHRILNLKPK